jgi:hypothetical protein
VDVVGALNRVFEHGGRQFHLQVEDLGRDHKSFEVRVYDGGTILWHKRIPYDDLLAKGLDKTQAEEELRSLMEKTLHTVEAAIAKGKLG